MDFDRDRDENTPYTVNDIARELHMEHGSVYLAIKRGALPARKVLGRWLVDADDFRRVRAGSPLAKKVQDIDALKAEVERLRADNERLRGRVEALEKVRIAATAFIQFDALEAALEEAAR
jgi:hypothetical protein